MFTRTLVLVIVAACLASCRGSSSTTAGSPERLPKPPLELLKYRNDSANAIDAGGPLATDTYQLYNNTDSYSMLRAVILDQRAEPQVLPYAIERALLLVGPERFFSDVRRDAAANPVLFADGLRRELLDRSREQHIWVSDSAFINDRDIPRSKARKLFEQIISQVRAGASFGKVYFRMQAEHSYLQEKMRLTQVGNYGDWVLSSSKRTADHFFWTDISPLPENGPQCGPYKIFAIPPV